MTERSVKWPEYHVRKQPDKPPRPQYENGRWRMQGEYQYSQGIKNIIVSYHITLGAFIFSGGGIMEVISSFKGHHFLYGLVQLLITGAAFVFFVTAALSFRESFSRNAREGQERKYTPPALFLPSEELRLGDSVSLTFERGLNANRPLSGPVQIHARLLEVEVTCQMSKWGPTFKHKFLTERRLPTVAAGQGRLSATWQVSLMPSSPFIRVAENHGYFWQLQVLQELPGQEPFLSEFMLPVAPS